MSIRREEMKKTFEEWFSATWTSTTMTAAEQAGMAIAWIACADQYQSRIAELEADHRRTVDVYMKVSDELRDAKAELSALKSPQEPVGTVDGFGAIWWKDRPPQGTELYTRPVPAKVPAHTGHDGLTWPDTLDANVWADEFCKRNSASDHGTMLAWFANAIMRGDDSRSVIRSVPDGEVVAAVDSHSDAAIIKWCSDYRPKVGDSIYTRPVPAKVPEGWKLVLEPDETGLGRLIVDGKYYGLPMSVINWLGRSAQVPEGLPPQDNLEGRN